MESIRYWQHRLDSAPVWAHASIRPTLVRFQPIKACLQGLYGCCWDVRQALWLRFLSLKSDGLKFDENLWKASQQPPKQIPQYFICAMIQFYGYRCYYMMTILSALLILKRLHWCAAWFRQSFWITSSGRVRLFTKMTDNSVFSFICWWPSIVRC